MRRSGVLGLVAVATALAATASAQEPVADSYERLRGSNRLKPGDAVSVTRGDGTQTLGTVESLSPESLRLRVGRQSLELSEDSVDIVKRRDAISDGAWIGLAVGVGTMLIANRVMCNDDPECGAIVNVYVGLPAIGVGALAGALIDRSQAETVFQSRTGALSRLTVAPLVSRKRNGVLLALRW